MYCHMEEDKCGVRGVMRVVNINMTNPQETCPSPLTLYSADYKRLCGPTVPLSPSPPSTTSTVMYVVELSGSLTTILVHFDTVPSILWMKLMSQGCPSLMVSLGSVPIYGHMLGASKNKMTLLHTIVPVLKSQE